MKRNQKMKRDIVRPAGRGFLEIETSSGWQVLLSPGEIQSVRGRCEGGTVIHTVNGQKPIMLDVPVTQVLAALKGGDHGTA
jgi:hypothetical protein